MRLVEQSPRDKTSGKHVNSNLSSVGTAIGAGFGISIFTRLPLASALFWIAYLFPALFQGLVLPPINESRLLQTMETGFPVRKKSAFCTFSSTPKISLYYCYPLLSSVLLIILLSHCLTFGVLRHPQQNNFLNPAQV